MCWCAIKKLLTHLLTYSSADQWQETVCITKINWLTWEFKKVILKSHLLAFAIISRSVGGLRPVTSHPGQLSLAIPSWIGTMSTSQRAVMPYGWGVKAGMVRVWVAGKTVWSPCYTRALSERFRDKELRIKRYINSPSLLLLYWGLRFLIYYLAISLSMHCSYILQPLTRDAISRHLVDWFQQNLVQMTIIRVATDKLLKVRCNFWSGS